MAIEHINEFDTLNAGREKINKHAIDPANRAELNAIDAKSVANQANQTSQSAEAIAINTDDRLDNIIAGEMQDAEVIDARKPFGGEAYPTLGDRLDSDKAEVSRKLENFFNVRAFLCDDGEYVKGDGKHDDTTGIQNALDNAVGTLFFPRGIYKITKSLILNRNIDLIGFSRRDSVIRADGFTAEQDLLTVAITNNFGGLDVRGWSLKNLSLFLNAGGNWSLKILGGSTFEGAMQILSGEIDNISGSIYIKNNFAHGVIRRSGISRLYLECYDANVIEKNLFFGNDTAITIDIISGVRNNVIRDNTIVNKNGAIKIINGDNVRIQNNQLEHMTGQGKNDLGYMILVEGKDRTVTNLVISENNFGGGSNVPNSILVDNAEDTIIEKNNFIATLENDIVITEKAKNTIIKPDNHSMPLGHIPRPNGIKILGEDYIGQPNNLSGENGWNDFKVIKETRYLVNVLEGLNGGLSEPESSISTLPIGLRTSVNETIPVLTSDGFGELRQGFNGKLFVKNIPSNKNVKVLPFHVDNSEHTNTKYTMYDDFNRVSFGTSNTGHVWETTHNNYQIIDGEVALIDIALEDFALITSNTVNPFMTLRLPKISTGHTKAIKLIFNYVDENNYCYLSVRDLSGYGFRFYKVVNGVEIEIGGYGNHSHIKDNMVITLEVKDSEVVLRTNGGYTISVVLEDKPRGFKHGFALSKTETNLVDDFAIKS